MQKITPLTVVLGGLLVYLISSVFSLLCLGSLFAGEPNDYLLIAVVCYGVFTLLAPLLSSSILLFSLPIFGNKPATSQYYYFLILSSTYLLFGFLGVLLNSDYRDRKPGRVDELLLVYLFFFVSIFSLSSVPLREVFSLHLGNFLVSFEFGSFKEIAVASREFLFQNEMTPSYSVLSVLLTTQAFGIALLMRRFVQRQSSRTIALFLSILLGLVFSLLAGFVDYFGFYSLEWLRDLDPTANPGGQQFRMQSLFGHSGWFAEYLTLAIPMVLGLFLLRIPYLLRVLIALGVMILGEVALILSFQRGGWISYPLTLFAVWAAIYVVYKIEKSNTGVRPALIGASWKILLSLPLTVMASFYLLAVIQGKTTTEVVETYQGRFYQISKVSDRWEFVEAGYKLSTLHPFFGAGSESFGYEYEKEFVDPDGAFHGEQILPLHGSAHNVYAQTLAGKGWMGLLILVGLFTGLFLSCLKVVFTGNKTFHLDDKLIALTGVCFSVAFLIYGFVQEVFYVQVLQVLVFVVLVLVLSSISVRIPGENVVGAAWVPLFFLFAIGHGIWEFYHPGASLANWNKTLEFGCYLPEKEPSGRSFRWCGPTANVELPFCSDGSGNALFNVKVATMYVEPSAGHVEPSAGHVEPSAGAELEVGRGGWVVVEKLVLNPNEEKTLSFLLPLDVLESRSIPAPGTRGQAVLELRTKTSFVPAEVIDGSRDTRRLAYRIYESAPGC